MTAFAPSREMLSTAARMSASLVPNSSKDTARGRPAVSAAARKAPALGPAGLKIARRLLLVLCCAATASGHATAPHTTLRKARRLMSAPSLGQRILLACEPHSTPSDRHQ